MRTAVRRSSNTAIARRFAAAGRILASTPAASSRCLPLLLLPLLLAPSASATITSRARKGNGDSSNKINNFVASAGPLPDSLGDQPYTPNFEMAWSCSAHSNEALVDRLRQNGLIKTQRVLDAMRAVDRGFFAPRSPQGKIVPATAYQDAPQYLGYGATISAPHMHAMCLELLVDHLQPGMRALDVGSGSGYLVAAMAEMVAPRKAKAGAAAAAAAETKVEEGKQAAAAAAAGASTASGSVGPLVCGIEHIEPLVAMSQANLGAWDPEFAARIAVAKGDGRLGIAGQSFDAIHVGAAAATIPSALIEQLRPGGRLVIPVGPEGGHQRLEVIDKAADGQLHRRVVTGVAYVPLTSEQHQLEKSS